MKEDAKKLLNGECVISNYVKSAKQIKEVAIEGLKRVADFDIVNIDDCMDYTDTGWKVSEDYFELRYVSNPMTLICPDCGANNDIDLEYQGRIFCWQCGKEIIR